MYCDSRGSVPFPTLPNLHRRVPMANSGAARRCAGEAVGIGQPEKQPGMLTHRSSCHRLCSTRPISGGTVPTQVAWRKPPSQPGGAGCAPHEELLVLLTRQMGTGLEKKPPPGEERATWAALQLPTCSICTAAYLALRFPVFTPVQTITHIYRSLPQLFEDTGYQSLKNGCNSK